MPRIRHLYDDCVYHRQIQGCRHAIVKETRVCHLAFGIVDVFLVQCPADALHNAALDLPLNVTRMDGFASILRCGVAKNLHLAGILVYLQIDDMGCECAASTRWIHGSSANDGAACLTKSRGQVAETNLLLFAVDAGEFAIGELHVFLINFPESRRAGNHLLFDILRGFISGVAGGERRAAAACHGSVANRIGINDAGIDSFCGDTEHFRCLHGDGCARAADVR